MEQGIVPIPTLVRIPIPSWTSFSLTSWHSIDPGEPTDLEPDVLWRIVMLKYTYRDGCENASRQLDNLNGILDGYRSGNLRVREGVLLYSSPATRQWGHFNPTNFKRRNISK